MNVPATQPLKPLDGSRHPALPPANTRLSPLDMSGVVSHHRKNAGPDTPGFAVTEHAKLHEQARKWVAQTFFGTMLKQMRQSPFRSELFEGGRGGQAYTELFDQKMVEHMSRGAGGKLVNTLVRKLEAKKAYAKQGPETADSSDKTASKAPGPQGAGQGGNEKRSTADPRPGTFNKSRSHVPSARGS